MPRVKRGKSHLKKRKNLLKRVKGFLLGRKSLIKLAKTADTKAGAYAYRDRRNKKREMRRLWQIKINAAVRGLGTTYSQFMGSLGKKNIALDRKVLSELAANQPQIFEKIVEQAK
ncbi:MAG: 50S ribosomal protein L20 [Candidatus Magasanikbacteria bacterium CG11_big_fil_rev_8_21_14_0_20_39_34]|uniref:Large ribosomal subunit protein bL20 n=1 Tax=Candidatus Magasanikbacteria bacterium CG11_big_fil_rev_8_21_14_0_20_39_34 TaxID=1974653 RepID=A0A2H0N4K5_9BACT|nr:MAG: 50S ribosomal protein L20 [Candidatus Magasanikbacteria bacterium CG11_big_fil_rev_8_21_14_0_20_39_34]